MARAVNVVLTGSRVGAANLVEREKLDFLGLQEALVCRVKLVLLEKTEMRVPKETVDLLVSLDTQGKWESLGPWVVKDREENRA